VTHESDQVAEHDSDADVDEDQWQVVGNVQEFIAVEKTRRNPRKPSWLTTNMIVAYAFPITEEAIPSAYRWVEISLESKMYEDAMMEEMSSLHKNDTWELSELLNDCKWVFAKKHESLDGNTVCYKARLVAKGFL